MLDDPVVLHGADRGDRGRAGQRVAGVGEPAGVGAVGEGRGDRLAHRDPAERDVAGVDALGEGQQVGHDPVELAGEPAAGAAEAGHHLVGDQQDAVPVAQLAHPGEVAGAAAP